MGMRWAAVLVLAAWPTAAQERFDPPARPKFLAAIGLLTVTPLRMDEAATGGPVAAPFSVTLPGSGDVTARVNTEVEGALAVVDFTTTEGQFLESVIFTPARIDAGTPQDRAFRMANLLVLTSFPSLQQTYPDARVLGFGPVTIGDLPAVQMVGAFTGPGVGPVVFRHVGFLPEGQEDTVVALVNVAVERMPLRDDAALEDTFTGWTLRSLAFDPPQ